LLKTNDELISIGSLSGKEIDEINELLTLQKSQKSLEDSVLSSDVPHPLELYIQKISLLSQAVQNFSGKRYYSTLDYAFKPELRSRSAGNGHFVWSRSSA